MSGKKQIGWIGLFCLVIGMLGFAAVPEFRIGMAGGEIAHEYVLPTLLIGVCSVMGVALALAWVILDIGEGPLWNRFDKDDKTVIKLSVLGTFILLFGLTLRGIAQTHFETVLSGGLILFSIVLFIIPLTHCLMKIK